MSVTKCMTPNCTAPSSLGLGRGLCMRCYKVAKKMVEDSSTTWEKLAELGLALEDPFSVALRDTLKKKTGDGNAISG